MDGKERLKFVSTAIRHKAVNVEKILDEIDNLTEIRNKKARRMRKVASKNICYWLCFGRHSEALWAVYFVAVIFLLTYYSFKLVGTPALPMTVLSIIIAIIGYSFFSRTYCRKISERIDKGLEAYEEKIQSKILKLSEGLGFKVSLDSGTCSWMQNLHIEKRPPQEELKYLDNTDTDCTKRYCIVDNQGNLTYLNLETR